MEISFEQSFAGLFIFISIILAGAFSYLVYFRNQGNSVLNQYQKIFLFLCRFITLFLVFLFLLSPLLVRKKTIKQLPVLAVAFDNSQSVQANNPFFKRFIEDVRSRFSKKYQLEFWSFGERTEKTDQVTGTDRSSNYGQLLKTLKTNYQNINIGALILLGDGIYNQGQNPENLVNSLKFPIYTIGVGDTVRNLDAQIIHVKTNQVAFLKNKFPVEIELKFLKLKNQMAQLEVENNQKMVYSGTIPIVSDDDFKLELMNLDAEIPGLQHYKVKIRQFAGETNVKNNEYEFVIQILENKQKILILSDGPHPDLGAIKTSLSELQNYEIKLVTGNQVPDSLSVFNLIILNQLPSVKNSLSSLLTRIKSSRIPVLFIIGPNSLTEQLNSLNMGLQISASKNTEEVQPLFDNSFSLFTLSDATKETFSQAPPLLAPFGNTELSSGIQNLAKQNIRNLETGKTLLAFGNEKGRKTGFILGEGIWRWRLADFELNQNHEAFNELIRKIIQYLALKQNEDNFNVYYPALFQETDQVELTAELYNDSYELTTTPDVKIKIKNDSLREFNYQFDRAETYYRLDAGMLKPGDYTFEAETQLGNQRFVESGKFSVAKNDVETQRTTADFDVLYQLSNKTGGRFYQVDKSGTLLDTIEANKQMVIHKYQQSKQSDWIDLKWLLFGIVFLLGTEWFCRKYWGIY